MSAGNNRPWPGASAPNPGTPNNRPGTTVKRDKNGAVAVGSISVSGANLGASDLVKLATYPSTRGHVEAYQSANIARASGTAYDFVTDNTPRDVNGEWNGVTGTFTCAHAGTFLVTGNVMIIAPPDQAALIVQITDAANVELFRAGGAKQSGATGDLAVNFAVPIYFGAAGGVCKVRLTTSNAGATAQNSRGGAAFMWLKIRELA